jgi:Ca2+-binding RTX toxin-like protein
MAEYYNSLGSSTVTGTSTKDLFFAFARDQNFDHVRADAVISNLDWATGIGRSDGSSYRILASNIQISTDLLSGGDGTDVAYGSNLADALFYNNGSIAGGFGGFSSIESFWLADGDDVIDLTAHGAGGTDYLKDVNIHGEGGNDTIIGGAGKDALYGDGGNDVLFGYRGADTLYGGTGNDVLYGDDLGYNGIAGDDLLDGGAGDDTLYGGARSDKLIGGDGNDRLYGQNGSDNLSGGAGDDILYGDDEDTASNDILNGDGGNDQVFGGGGDDEMYGGSGDDLLDGGLGIDYLSGGAGNDTLIAGLGNDTLDGGIDIDTAVFSGNRADYLFTLNADGSYTVVDGRATALDGTDRIRNIEWLSFADGTISGSEINYPPVITSNGGGSSAAVSILENTTAVTLLTATDADVGQTLTFSIADGADAALFTIGAATGLLSFIAAPNFENPADADRDNVYQLVVAASDGNGGIDTQILTATVQDVPDGLAPVITSNGGGPTTALLFVENGVAVTTVSATDPDGPALSFTITGGADAGLLTLNAATGELFFKSAPDFENPSDADHDGIYDVIVQASDGENADQQILAISVTNANDNAPLITSNGGGATAAISVAENATAVALITATDADGSPLVYSIEGGADRFLFTVDAASGQLSFLAAPDYESPSDSDGDRTYEVVVGVSDGITTAIQSLAIGLTNLNDNAPVLTSNGGSASAAISMAENGTALTTVTATDADGTAPSYVLSGGADASLFQIQVATGALSFITAPDFENRIDADHDGVYQVIVRATDGVNSTDQALSVTITDVNEVGKTITGSSGSNTISPTQTVVGYQTTVLNDTIYGLAGNDVIDGGSGADYMDGGLGNDTFYVETYSDDGFAGNDDRVVEAAGGGTDIVYASVSYRLAAEVENLTLAGAAAISGTGNVLANVITGNGAVNTFSGEEGNDTIYGGGGDDILYGGAGTDTLDGGAGADVMDGGLDSDAYTVDTYSDDGIATNDDRVVELAGGGSADLVNASVSYLLADQVERLTLTGAAAIDGTGNNLDNVITGNSAANFLSGGLGNDALVGGGGDDRLLGGEGSDTLDGGIGNDQLDGGAANDTLNGREGDDILVGGAGKDLLTGGTGADTFFFNFGDTSQSLSSLDKITDFQTGIDVIDVHTVAGPLTAAAYSEATIGSSVFTDALTLAKTMMGGGKVAAFVAGTTDGWVFWDGNGDGLIDQSVILGNVNTLAGFTCTDLV